MDELELDPRKLAQETDSLPDRQVRVRVVHVPSGTFGEAAGQTWEQGSLIRKAREELAAKLGGGGAAGVPAKMPPGPSSPGELAAEAAPPQDGQ